MGYGYCVSAPGPLDINLALEKEAWQQSVYTNAGPQRGNDGNFHPNWNQKTCSMTNSHSHAWWAVDLERSYRLDRVLVTNRDSSREFMSTSHKMCITHNGSLTRYVKLWVAHAPGMLGTFSPPPTSRETAS